MLGSGIFINSTILAKHGAFIGAACYILVGLLMLPLILSISRLLTLHPAGGFYTFAQKEIHPFAGFLSAWCYATGKLGSAVIITQIAVLLLQQVIPILGSYNPLLLNGCIMAVFLALNMLDIKTNSAIQSGFFVLKTIPILCGMSAGIYLFSSSHIPFNQINFAGIPIALPLVLFAIAGFEAACSLSSRIENAQKNAPKAILYSFFAVICTTTLFQFFLYGGLGSLLASLPDYRAVFPSLIAHILPSAPLIGTILIKAIHLAIACSALGGSYGIIFSNAWNIYALAEHNHLIGSRWLKVLNRYSIPWLCVLFEGFIYFLFLMVSHGSQIPLQQIGALGPTIAYGLSALSLFYAVRSQKTSLWIGLPLLAMISCLILFSSSIYSLLTLGISSLMLFGSLLALGIMMFAVNI